ncbi:MAG: hypothetical protein J5953_10925 [Prevotella sp.]|nr:hypothetical protein [Prevotella sp.]
MGASKPEGYGGYYTWGETSTKRSYTEGNYLNGNGKYFYVGKNIAGTDYDAAPANWSSSWVMPSLEQMKELKVKCKCVWTTKNGVNGQKFTGPNGASIFLPAAGIRRNEDLDYAGSEGFYWSSTLNESHTNCAWYLYFYSWVVDTAYDGRFDGRSVRPVRKN